MIGTDSHLAADVIMALSPIWRNSGRRALGFSNFGAFLEGDTRMPDYLVMTKVTCRKDRGFQSFLLFGHHSME